MVNVLNLNYSFCFSHLTASCNQKQVYNDILQHNCIAIYSIEAVKITIQLF